MVYYSYDKNTHKVITIFEDRKQDIILETMIAEKEVFLSNKNIGWIEKIFQFFQNLKIFYK